MRTVVLLAIIFASAFAATQYKYVKTIIPCQLTEPANPGTGWSYCVEQSMWIKTDCDTLESYNDIPDHKVMCTNGYAYAWMNLMKKDTEETESLSKRVTYSKCPMPGSDKDVCCPSPKTCHNGNTPGTICY